MITALKAEFRKLLTVRSTYIALGFAFLLELLFAFYATGWKAQGAELASSHYVSSQVTSALVPLTLLAGIVAVLLVSHEYRYNTIMYSLTSNKSRTRVLVAKLFAISCFAIVFSLFFGILSPLLGILGIHLHGHNLGPQFIPVWSLIWRAAFYGWGFAMLASIMAFIIRIQVGALAAMFLVPGMVEQILGLLLRDNQVYLPFSSLAILLGEGTTPGPHISFVKAAIVTSIYIVVGWLVAWVLFLKRDVN